MTTPTITTAVHTMRRTMTLDGGIEQWSCPTCGHSAIYSFTPPGRRIIRLGDPTVQHTGSDQTDAAVAGSADPWEVVQGRLPLGGAA